MRAECRTDDDLCCICFDRMPNIVLPCLHTFCQKCIQNWQGSAYKLPGSSQRSGRSSAPPATTDDENRSQCPLCRNKFADTTNAWQMIDIPSVDEFKQELPGYIRRLIERTGRAVDRPPPNLFADLPTSDSSQRGVGSNSVKFV